MRKRLLHISGYALRGGTESCCAVFLRHAPAFDHHVLVLGTEGPMSAVWERDGASVTHLDILSSGWWGFRNRLREALSGLRYDGVIVWAGIRVPIVCALLADLGCPVSLHLGNPFQVSFRVRALLSLASVFAQKPSRLVSLSCSAHVEESHRRVPYYNRTLAGVCMNPIEAPPVNRHEARPLWKQEIVRLGMVARLDPIKDHRSLIVAFAELKRSWVKAELHLAGDGPLRGVLEKLAGSLGVASSVVFHGSIGNVPEFLGTLDLYCFMTTAQEGLGNALIEAMAHGLPCVVRDLPVMREISGDSSRHGIAFTSRVTADIVGTLDSVLLDADRRRQMSEDAWNRARSAFAPSKVVSTYLNAMGVRQ